MSGTSRVAPAWYALFYAVCIVTMSVLTITTAKSLSDHRAWLPAIEIIGVVLLVMRRTAITGMAILLVVYAVVAIHTLQSGDIPLDLVLYAGTAVFVAQLRRPALTGGGG